MPSRRWKLRLNKSQEGEKEELLAKLREAIGWPEVPAESPLAVMGWDEVERLSTTGLFQFGSHTHTHPTRALQASRSSAANWRSHATSCETVICRGSFLPIRTARLPIFQRATESLLVELGYDCGLTTIPGLNSPEKVPVCVVQGARRRRCLAAQIQVPDGRLNRLAGRGRYA